MSTFHRPPRFLRPAQVLWLLVIAFAPSLSGATTIIGMIDLRHDSMILAADSKFRVDQTKTVSSNGAACKIVVGNDYAFAIDGWVSSDLVKFDALEVANRACASGGDVFEKAAKFNTLLEEPFLHLVEQARAKVPEYYAQGVADGRLGVMIVLAGSHNGRLSLELGGFKVTPNGIQPITHELNEGTLDPLMTVVGSGLEAISRFSHAHPEWRKEQDPINAVKKFMQIATMDDPADVGPPISIVEIRHSLMSTDRNRVTLRWIERGLCTENNSN
jgi:hypothetical protein